MHFRLPRLLFSKRGGGVNGGIAGSFKNVRVIVGGHFTDDHSEHCSTLFGVFFVVLRQVFIVSKPHGIR